MSRANGPTIWHASESWNGPVDVLAMFCFQLCASTGRGHWRPAANARAAIGIEPLGAESIDNTVWVHSKEVDPYGVEDKEQEVA
jgi:hypothetical protein